MGSLNEVTLAGALGADPELKYGPSGKAMCNLSIATQETWKDKDGKKQERTDWHRVTVYGDMAENCAKYLAKGRQVLVKGRLSYRTYEKDGQKHYATDITADKVVFLGSGNGQTQLPQNQRSNQAERQGQRAEPAYEAPSDEPSIPF